MVTSLEEILDDQKPQPKEAKEPEPVADEPAPEPDEDAETEEPETEEGESAAQAAPEPEPEQPSEADLERTEGWKPGDWRTNAYFSLKSKKQESDQDNADLRERVALYEAQLQRFNQQQQQQPGQGIPDPYDDPQGYHRAIAASVHDQMETMRLGMLETMAIQTHGAEAVEAAKAAIRVEANANPHVLSQFTGSPNPVGALVEWHKRKQVMDEIGSDPDAWRQAERERIMAEMRNAPPAPKPEPKPAPNMPADLSTTPNTVRRTSGPEWAGETPLSDILDQ